ncbi:MAG: hypothetical protein EBR82_42375 [Caulobacteraceae bacterium]|nr:hypothetical protein [Caulobacteraceae bacterium]
MKTCTSCKIKKELSEFNKNKTGADGLQYHCKECRKSRYQKDRENIIIRASDWYHKNKHRKQEYDKQRRMAKKEHLANYEKARSKTPKRKILAMVSLQQRRARQIKSTPKWFDEFDKFVIKEAMSLAAKRKELTGFSWHLDHIVPVRGKTVCGLHWHKNWQVAPADYNKTKGNKFPYPTYFERNV